MKTEMEAAKFDRQERKMDEEFRTKMGWSVDQFKYWKAMIKQNPDYFDK